jgi:3-oxoacyl-[acyl-carrier protein] reductase/meso-butanediol dehydrogenase/(S,S)-butanediol dehydrogenase/diacetyl reductase
MRALVTGGTGRVGTAIVRRLEAEGASVIAAGRREGDVSRPEEARALVERAAAELCGLDLLVNAAGEGVQPKSALELSEADWDRMLGINAKAVFFLSQLVLPGMRERRRGAVVNLASVAGKIATGVNYLHYNVSKAAVIAMTKTLAHAVAKDGVRVNCVCPGIIDTDMWAQIDREQGVERMGLAERELMNSRLAAVPMGRAGTPEDVAKVILFLASPLAAYMTGQAINITGGSEIH